MLKDVSPPIDYPFPLAVVLLTGLALLCFFILLIFLLSKIRKKKIKIPNVPKITPWDKAYEELKRLELSDLLTQGLLNQYYSILSGIIRSYFEERFNIRAPEMTTEEFLISLKTSKELNEFQKETLKNFMTSCDMVKFAKYTPDVSEAHKSLQLARKIVDETKRITQ